MLVLPIPLITALVLGFLALRMMTGDRRPLATAAFLCACALQSLIVALAQYYQISWLHLVQPVTATSVPAMAWLAFQSSFLRRLNPGRDSIHIVAPAFTVFCIVFAPQTVDAVIPAIFLFYGGLILYTLKTAGGGPLLMARLEADQQPQWLWTGIAASLIFSAFSDILIAIAFLNGNHALALLIVSIFTSFALLAAGLLSLSPNAFGETEPEENPKQAAQLAGPQSGDREVVERLDALLRKEQLFLDAALTLSRLARRLQIPAKQLSAALNRVTGENVSRYINRFRIEHACTGLKAGETVTNAMLSSGFNTKSNFNREFSRITGKSPTAWLSDTDLTEEEQNPPSSSDT